MVLSSGATHVWLPPPSQSVSPQGYLPGQLYNLNSKYGTAEELRALCGERRLKTSGNKDELILRLAAYDAKVAEGGAAGAGRRRDALAAAPGGRACPGRTHPTLTTGAAARCTAGRDQSQGQLGDGAKG